MHTAIRAAEDALFSEWRSRCARFCADGVVDEARFAGASVKLLFLLKETNDARRGFDLRTFLRDGAVLNDTKVPPTWVNLARWVEGIHQVVGGAPVRDWTHFEGIRTDIDRRKAAFAQIAAVNLKKAAGTHTTRNDELQAATKTDTDHLRAQLGLYQAKFTICCGSSVAEAVRANELLDGVLNREEWPRTRRGIPYKRTDRHGVVIDFSHPAARVASSLLLYGLLDAVAEIDAASPK